MFNKKNLIYAGLFVASFLVINVGVFFFLKATQPKVGARVGDSIAAHAQGDSLAPVSEVHPDSARTDSTDHAANALTAADTAANSDHAAVAPEPEAAQPVVTKETEIPVETAMQKPEEKIVDEKPAGNTEAVVTAALAGDAKEMAKLAKLLESMKPDEAADIVSHLSIDQIVTLVMKMKDRAAGRMLAALPIEQAARVAERMSQTASRSQGG